MKRLLTGTLAGFAALALATGPARGQAIKIGGLFDLTGVTSEVGKPFAQAVIDHVTVINEQGGINGKKIELSAVDYGYKIPQAVATYKKFKDEDKVILINGWGTGDTEALKEFVSKDQIPYISASFSAHLTDPAKTPYNFFVGASYSDQLRIFLKYAKDSWKDSSRKPRVAFIYSDNPYGKAPMEAGRQYAKEIGVDLVDEEVVPPSFQDSTSQLLNMQKASPDFAYINTTTSWVAIILRDALKLGVKTKFGINPYGCGELLPKVAKDAAEGTLCMMPNVAYGENVPGMKAILDLHKAKSPQVSTDNLYVRGWVYVTVWAEAVRRATELAGPGIKKALESLRDFDTGGLTPPITYTAEDHRPTTRCAIYEVNGGKLAKVGEIEVPRKREWLGL
jgi:branched-chain amino acid transport system substrate-binding protein